MAEEKAGAAIEELIKQAKEYFNTQLELFKLRAIKTLSEIFSSVVIALSFILIGTLVLILVSIGLSIYIGQLAGSFFAGFFIVSGIYLLIGIILIIFRRRLLKRPLRNWLIKSLLG